MLVLDFVGAFAFALSGGVAGVRRHVDIFGVLTLACLTALGGGVVRDVLLGLTPPANLTSVPLITTALAGGMIPFLAMPSLDRLRHQEQPAHRGLGSTVHQARRLVLVADAAGLGTFAVSGTLRAITTGHPGIEAVCVGLITAVGGGILRDAVSGKVADVFGTELYALPALLGALLTDLAVRTGHDERAWQWGIVALVFGLRLAAVRFRWTSPTPEGVSRAGHRVRTRRHSPAQTPHQQRTGMPRRRGRRRGERGDDEARR